MVTGHCVLLSEEEVLERAVNLEEEKVRLPRFPQGCLANAGGRQRLARNAEVHRMKVAVEVLRGPPASRSREGFAQVSA